MTRLMKTLVLTMVCGGLAALPATAQTPSELQDQIDALQAQITALQSAFPDCMTIGVGSGLGRRYHLYGLQRARAKRPGRNR